MRCFYCKVRLLYQKPEQNKRVPPETATKDHIVPQSAPEFQHFTWKQHKANIVEACYRCNCDKADADPFLCLLVLPDYAAHALAHKLREIGFSDRRIGVALGKRKRMA